MNRNVKTVVGLARRENDAIDCESKDLNPGIFAKYRLRGRVVYSRLASGCHCYSYKKDGDQWYKFGYKDQWYKYGYNDNTEVNMP